MSKGGGVTGVRRRPKSKGTTTARGTMGTGPTSSQMKVEGAMGKHQRTGDGMCKGASS